MDSTRNTFQTISSVLLSECVALNVEKSVQLFSGPDIYRMDCEEKGFCLIVDNLKFQTLKRRNGSRADAIQLQSIFSQIGYKVIHVRDQTQSELESILDHIRLNPKLEDHNSLIVIMLSHGLEDGMICCSDYSDQITRTGFVTAKQISHLFNDKNCPRLKGKPKLYFFSCCRGGQIDENDKKTESTSYDSSLTDTFIGYGTQSGCVGFRDEDLGSMFGNSIAEALMNCCHKSNLDQIWNQIEEKCKQKSSFTVWDQKKGLINVRQTPDFKKFGFNKKLYFNPKISKDKSLENCETKRIPFESGKENNFLRKLKTSNFLKDLNNEKIVQYFSVWVENRVNTNNSFDLVLCAQMEVCDRNLVDIIEELEKDINLMQSKDKVKRLTPLGFYLMSEIFIEILEGVNHLHKQKPPIIHRDLKTANIMLKIGSNNRFVKIGNLGLATILEYSDQSLSGESFSHNSFVAPEVITKRYDTKADIYSLGYLFQHIFKIDINGDFQNIDPILLRKYEYSNELFIRMIARQSTKRPNCNEILDEKRSWGLSAQEFDAKNALRNAVKNAKTSDSYIYSILNLKINS